MTLFKIAGGTVLVSVIAAAAFAHGGATGIVKQRMDGMGVMKDSMKALTPMMQGKTPYDAATVRDEAEKIGDHAGKALTKLFPEGSDGMPSEAKPEIWTDWQDFSGLAEQLRGYSEGLALAAENGLMMAGSGQGTDMMSGSSMMGGGMMGGGMMDGGMMGGGMMGGVPDPETLSAMPADGVFMMLSQTCSACHTRFRSEKE